MLFNIKSFGIMLTNKLPLALLGYSSVTTPLAVRIIPIVEVMQP